MNWLFRKIRLMIKPIKKGDVLMCDHSAICTGRYVPLILHGLVSIEGDITHKPWPGPDTYRMTVTNVSMPYYVLDAEILTIESATAQFVWKQRITPRRISKHEIHSMILDGILTRS